MRILCAIFIVVFALPAFADRDISILSAEGDVRASFIVEIADTYEERAKGLMFRDRLGANKGMLFLYPNESVKSFWMRNTFIPLDILFFDSEDTLVHIVANTEPLDEKSLLSVYPAKSALELNAMTANKYGIIIGDKLQINNKESTNNP